MEREFTKKDIADLKRVTPRTVDNWRESGLLDPPLKLGNKPQSRVRWTESQVKRLDARLRGEAA
jgi:phage terminase Nu1 subunit (DNA packaging protein)